MFQFRRFPTYAYLIQHTLTGSSPAGLPHSEISGSKLICSSPKLIAAYHVFHRLLMPRHSPCALNSLTSSPQAPYPSLPAFGRKLAHSAAAPLSIESASLGFDAVWKAVEWFHFAYAFKVYFFLRIDLFFGSLHWKSIRIMQAQDRLFCSLCYPLLESFHN